ncbi:MAG: methyltransferase family protein [Clostridia bacterium]
MEELFEPTAHNALFVLVTLLWWAEFIIFPSRMSSRPQREGKRSYRLIFLAVSFTVASSLLLYSMGIGSIAATLAPVARTLGLAIYTSGLILRYWSSVLLGREFTRGINASDQLRLVGDGPYRILRHPLYLGLLLLTLGVPTFLGNFLGLAVGFVVMFVSLSRRIEVEEKQLLATLGETYAEWMRGRYRLLPFIY